MANPYEILGVARGATDAEIKKAYHKLVMQHHPDKNAGNAASEEKFKEINNAFDILKDPQKRAAYDRFGDAAFAGGNGASAGAGGNPFGGMGGNPFGAGGFEFNFGGDGLDMSEMMEEMLRGAGINMGGRGRSGAGRRAAEPQEFRGRDMLHQVSISLRDAFFGKLETIKFTTNVKCEPCAGHGTADAKSAPICNTCGGSGYVRTRNGFFATESPCHECSGIGRNIKKRCAKCDGMGVSEQQREIEVKIPAGAMDGMRLRMAGMGEAGMLGGPAGDFYVDIHVRPDKVFTRDGADLLMRATVPFATLALGGNIDVEIIDDKKVDVKIPAGTQVGERMRMRGLGMPSGNGRGDLYLDIATEVPKKLSEKQKAALAEFAGTAPKKKRGLF
ncbi:MAG: molecular chaperone DnaJ [Alphaproteobacteria bacterium]|nr:molecular chaperone DnaJ [Alphaproteobacteria bacterium]MCL2890037.1 molecular chaperone DnaJ [Alphaproteobacteria bacterium]